MELAIVTFGMGFGDEGKGACVDYLSRQYIGCNPLVVRYTGGSQCGHAVVLPDGRSHIFSQFGSGTLAGVDTYLGPHMIINPIYMWREANHLKELGITDPYKMLYIHPHSLIATKYHIAMDQALSYKNHTCGHGIGVTRQYWINYGLDAITYNDLFDKNVLLYKLDLLRNRMLADINTRMSKAQYPLGTIDSTEKQKAFSFAIDSLSISPYIVAHELFSQLKISRDRMISELPHNDVCIFEGAQGVLLDEWVGFNPYTTWSTVTSDYADSLIQQCNSDATVVKIGCTRPYMTRHGFGPFPTYCSDLSFNEPHNPFNDYQGDFKYGHLDLVLLKYAQSMAKADYLAVSHLDQMQYGFHGYVDSYDQDIGLPDSKRCDIATMNSCAYKLRNVSFDTKSLTSKEHLLELFETVARVIILGNGPTYLNRELLMSWD